MTSSPFAARTLSFLRALSRNTTFRAVLPLVRFLNDAVSPDRQPDPVQRPARIR